MAEPAYDGESWAVPTPIVGRDPELTALDGALVEPVPGRRRLVMLLGEAGIGKSRVLAEFQARALARQARVLLARSYESTQIVCRSARFSMSRSLASPTPRPH